MMLRRAPLVLMTLAFGVSLQGCSQQGASSASAPAAQPSAQDAAAASDLSTYRELVKIKSDQMASQMGQSIVSKYPGSDAAKEVQKTLPEITQRYQENAEKYRLTSLWQYQVAPMEGGTQSTATIYSSEPSGSDQVRLVLRRHSAWGLSVFLFGSGHGFVCRNHCTLPVTVDGKRMGIKAFAPPTGEPALMIPDDKGFIALLGKAKKISIDVTPVGDYKQETLVYEVGGFDPNKWAPLTKSKGKKAEPEKK